MKDWLNALADFSDGHLAMLMTLILLYVPFTISLLLFYPENLINMNPFMYLLVGLCVGFVTLLPTMLIVIATRYTDEKGDELNGKWAIVSLFVAGSLCAILWTFVSVVYYIFASSKGVLPYLTIMSIIFYVVFPLVLVVVKTFEKN